MVTVEAAQCIARQMAAHSPDVQLAQTLFRMQLAQAWQIPRGARILEIGCGQGDMTAVLADAVGSGGHVTAVDRAAPDYGAPVSLGQSAEHLKSAPFGRRIDFHFQYDVLDAAHVFAPDAFDYVVLAHCSWYFESLDLLRRVLLRVRPWAGNLCYSEWDMEPCALDQIGHLLSVLIQGQIQAYKVDGAGNVRTPFSRTKLTQLLRETGWSISTEAAIDAALLKDADWEINDCLRSSAEEIEALDLPEKLREFLGSQLDTLRLLAAKGSNRPLPSYSILAKRSPEIGLLPRSVGNS